MSELSPKPQEPNPEPVSITLDQLIDVAMEKEASDIHFGEGTRIALRIHGKIAFLENVSALPKKQAEQILFAMLNDPKEQERLARVRELDFSYRHKNGVHFRVNAFYRSGRLAAVMRMIPKRAPTMDELGLPETLQKLTDLSQGLILITGSAGSGKSTTIQSMLHHINENQVKHVLTIENPIEYIFDDHQSFFSQREVGKDTLSFVNGLQSAVHEDASVVMVSDLFNMEVVNAALELAETGHLVIAAMSTNGTQATLSRLTSLFPQDQRDQLLDRLADHLKGLLSQVLVQRADARARIAVFELLLSSDSIRNLIRRGEFKQLHVAMASALEEGMITMDAYAEKLAENGLISKEALADFIGP